MGVQQAGRLISLTSPLGKDVLLLKDFEGREAISEPFRFTLFLYSQNKSVSFGSIVGKNATIEIATPNSPRYIHGFISQFSQGETTADNMTSYYATLVPWLWNLSLTAKCRIFQNKSVPDIIKQVFQDLGYNDFRVNLSGSYQPRVYCVQYRETDFEFISRLMEDEGIFYFFEHTSSKHTMVIADTSSAHKPCPGQDSCSYRPVGGEKGKDSVDSWSDQRQVRPAKYTINDYNFETPSNDLKSSAPTTVTDGKNDKLEIYDYEGKYQKKPDGDRYSKLRMGALEATHSEVSGSGNVCAFISGGVFSLTNHYRGDFNTSYILTSVTHRAVSNLGDAAAGANYSNEFTCIPKSATYRPPRTSRKPIVRGSQTALVVGKSGEEIWTDKYGRIKVQFHWDREGKKDENSSCWVRVAMPWAGKQWGSVSIPRIGQEVVVDFLEGDPDQPIVIGSVYNAEQMPPYPLPDKAVISGVKSNSSKGGGGYNEFVMDDTKGNELIRLHAQYDCESKIEHDQREEIVNNQTITIDEGNRSLEIKQGNDSTTLDLGASSLQAMQSIVLQVGQNSIRIDQTGVTITALNITLQGEVATQIAGTMTQINGSGELTLAGGILMIG
jgi:type VI secretion system secreted protein VgrG